MPGSSLWLVPLPDSPLHAILSKLITTSIPDLYPVAIPPRFSPHVTLTADTVPSRTEDARRWLDNLNLPAGTKELKVAVKEAQVGEVFFRRLTLRCEKSPELAELAGACRAAGAEVSEGDVQKWLRERYAPHLSLMYSDLPREEVSARLDEVTKLLRSAKGDGEGPLRAKGAEVWLVPTDKDIDAWQPIARRKLQDVEWSWEI